MHPKTIQAHVQISRDHLVLDFAERGRLHLTPQTARRLAARLRVLADQADPPTWSSNGNGHPR